jgi:hypothetical protein
MLLKVITDLLDMTIIREYWLNGASSVVKITYSERSDAIVNIESGQLCE